MELVSDLLAVEQAGFVQAAEFLVQRAGMGRPVRFSEVPIR